eukprot:4710290-Pyramimonas_sp.AAC.1
MARAIHATFCACRPRLSLSLPDKVWGAGRPDRSWPTIKTSAMDTGPYGFVRFACVLVGPRLP